MEMYRQNRDGTWSYVSQPIRPTRILRVERWLRRRGWHRLAHALARWDERGLGR